MGLFLLVLFTPILSTWEENVHELAVGGAGAHLLDLPDLRLEAAVHPGEHVMPGHKDDHHQMRSKTDEYFSL